MRAAYDVLRPSGAVERIPRTAWVAESNRAGFHCALSYIVCEFPEGDGFAEVWVFDDDLVLEVEPCGSGRLPLTWVVSDA